MIRPRFHVARAAALASSTLLAGALLAIVLPTVTASAAEGPCIGADGVTVVVDATDIGGSIVVKCAMGDPASGRAALETAGFVPTDSQPGMICAIDAQPDPCPTSFDGSYWAYWHAAADGEWTSYQVGADSSKPARGEIEGWRYNDGATGPGIVPADVAHAQSQASSATTVDGTSASSPDDWSSVVWMVAVVIAALVAVVAFVVRWVLLWSRKRQSAVEN